MDERWLKCVVRKGMFSDEMVVVIKTLTGEMASFFVPVDRVKGAVDKSGSVKVRFFQDNTRAWAVVPNETQTAVPVAESEFIPA